MLFLPFFLVIVKQEIMLFISLVLENVCLSMVNNEDLIFCTKVWLSFSFKASLICCNWCDVPSCFDSVWIYFSLWFYFYELFHLVAKSLINCYICCYVLPKDWHRVCESYKTNDVQWALQAKAILDRLQLVLVERSQNYQKKIQPSVKYLGILLGIEKSAVCNYFLSNI